ncbi:MAG: hypothetical protein M1831_006730 [Alyxoria varia]|nr:MAG: hypothetical protein M1831_006730 [Alyxoria varia]
MASSELATDNDNAARELNAEISASRLTDDEQSDLDTDPGTRSRSYGSTPTVSPPLSPVEGQGDDENQMSSRFDRIKALLNLNPFSNNDKHDSSSFIGGPAQHAFPRHLLVTVSQDHIRRELEMLEAKMQQQLKTHTKEAQDTQKSLTESKEQAKRLEQSVEDLRISLTKAQEDITKAERARRSADEKIARLEIQSFETERAHQEELVAVRSGHQERIHELKNHLDTLLSAHRTELESANAEQQRQRKDFDGKIVNSASAHKMDIERMESEHHMQMNEARSAEERLRSENTQQAGTIHQFENIIRSRKESMKWLRNNRRALLNEMESLRCQIETLDSAHSKMVQSLKAEHEEVMRNIQKILSDVKADRNEADGELQQRLSAFQGKSLEDAEPFVVQRKAMEHQIAEIQSKHGKELSAALNSHESDTNDLENRFQALRSESTLDKETPRSELESIKSQHYNALTDMDHKLKHENPAYASQEAKLGRLEGKQQRRSSKHIPPVSEQNQEDESRRHQLVERRSPGNQRGVDLKPIDTNTANSVSWAEQQRLMDSDESKSPKSAGTLGSRHSWHSTGLLSGADSPKNDKWHRFASYFGSRRHSERHRRSQESGGVALGHRRGKSENITQTSVGQSEESRHESFGAANPAEGASPNHESSVLRLRPYPRDRDRMRFGGRGASRSRQNSRPSSKELDASEAKGVLMEKPIEKPQLIGLSDDPGPAQKRPATVSFEKKQVQPQPVSLSDDPGPNQRRSATGVPRQRATKDETKSGWKARNEKSRSLAERQSHAMIEAGKSPLRAAVYEPWI